MINSDNYLIMGMTFSDGSSIYNQVGDKNLFEQIITVNTIEEDENLSKEEKVKLVNILNSDKYSPFQKRIMIMRTLDKEKEFSSKIGLILKERPSKMEMVKKIMLVFRDHYTKNDVLKKKFGEVLTSVETVRDMIKEIDDDFWKSPYNEDGTIKRVLESSNGSGVFLWMVIYKFMVGLESDFPDENERYKFIVENMVYACELQKSKMFNWLCIADIYDEFDLNVYCGSFLEEGFDNHMRDIWCLKPGDFSLVISNPPYQSEITGNNRSKPIYNLFTEKAIELAKMVLFITPSRWLAGGFGLENFRKMMFSRNDIRVIKHFDDATKIFGKSVEIKGGVSYFLIDIDYSGKTMFNEQECILGDYDIWVDQKYIKLIELSKNNSLSKITKSKSFWMNFNDNTLSKSKNENNILCYVSKNKGLKSYIPIDSLTKSSKDYIDYFKVFTPYAAGSTGDLGKFGNKIIGYPNEVASNTYMTFLVNSEEEARSLLSYMNTKFCNFFLSLRKNTQNMKPDTCKWIPMVPFDREWTDEMLFEYFNLSEEEQKLILEK